MCLDLIAGRLLGQYYTDGGIYQAFLSSNLFVQFGSFVSRVKLGVFGGMLHLSND